MLRKRFTRLDNESYAFRKRYEAVVLPLGTKFNDAEFMQYRNPVGFGPSSNTCPKCASQRAQLTFVRTSPKLRSVCSTTFSFVSGW